MSDSFFDHNEFKPRVIPTEIAGFGLVHLRELTSGEWRDALDLPAAFQAARIAWLAMVNAGDERLYADETAIAGLPMALVRGVVDASARIAGFKISATDSAATSAA
jgi:hypothetical protein